MELNDPGNAVVARFFTAHRTSVLICTLVLTVFFLFGALHIRNDLLLQDLFPYNHPYLKLHARFSQVFGTGASTVVICLRSLKGDVFNPAFLSKLKKMTEEISLWEEVYPKLTYSMASISAKVVQARGKGEVAVASLMWPEVPDTPEEMALLRTAVFSSPVYKGTLVSRDGAAALVFTEFRENIPYGRVHQALQRLVRDYSDDETAVHIVGFPALMGWIYHLRPQLFAVFAVSGSAVALVLFGLFRNMTGMVVPIVNATILTIWGLGFIGYTGINFSPLLYVLAFLAAARTTANSNQILSRWFEQLQACGYDRKKACYETMRTMLLPNAAAVATDAAGFAVLFFARIALMKQLAVIMTFWVSSIAMTGILTPILCSMLPVARKRGTTPEGYLQNDWSCRAVRVVFRFSTGRRGRYVLAVAITGLLVFSGIQVTNLKAGDPTPGSPLLFPEHLFNTDQAFIDRNFDASSENLILYYDGSPGSVYDPMVLNTFEAFECHMRDRLPNIYKSSVSVNQMVRMVNLSLHDGDMAWYQIPRNEPMSQFLIGYVRQSAGEQYLNRFVDGDLQRAQMILFFRDHTPETLSIIHEAAADFFKMHPVKTAGGEFKLAGGRIGLEMAVNEEIRTAHVRIDIAVLAAIFILCSLFFRSITAGFMLVIPLVVSNCVAFAYMAAHGIGLSINTLPIAAIGAGVGVDFAVYLYSRCREEFPLRDGDWLAALERAVSTSGRAAAYTGLTIILPITSWYFLSDMKFQAQMGVFLALIIAMNVVFTLTLHPLMIYILKPGFISGK